MPKQGTGKNRVEAILMEVIASGEKLIKTVDTMLGHTIQDSMQDLRDDVRYAKARQRVELMQGLPDSMLRGHIPLLAQELSAAIEDDLGRTAGDEVRRDLEPLRNTIIAHMEEARDLMGKID